MNLRDKYGGKPGYNVDVGTQVVCPECDEVMVVCIEKPSPKSKNWAHCFEARAFDNQAGKDAKCPKCGVQFYGESSGVYTREFGFTW